MESLHSICPLFPKPVLTEYAPRIHFVILNCIVKSLLAICKIFMRLQQPKILPAQLFAIFFPPCT